MGLLPPPTEELLEVMFGGSLGGAAAQSPVKGMVLDDNYV